MSRRLSADRIRTRVPPNSRAPFLSDRPHSQDRRRQFSGTGRDRTGKTDFSEDLENREEIHRLAVTDVALNRKVGSINPPRGRGIVLKMDVIELVAHASTAALPPPSVCSCSTACRGRWVQATNFTACFHSTTQPVSTQSRGCCNEPVRQSQAAVSWRVICARPLRMNSPSYCRPSTARTSPTWRVQLGGSASSSEMA